MGLTVYGGGGKPEEEKTVTAGTSVIEVNPSSGKVMKKVTVNPTPTESKSVTPTTSELTVTPSAGKHLSQVIVGAVEDVTPEVTAQTPIITQIAENLGVTITTPSGTNKQILQGNNANLLNIKNNAKKEGSYVWKKLTAQGGDFVDFVVSDSETAYPDGGMQGGYWYEKADGGIEIGEITPASNLSSVTIGTKLTSISRFILYNNQTTSLPQADNMWLLGLYLQSEKMSNYNNSPIYGYYTNINQYAVGFNVYYRGIAESLSALCNISDGNLVINVDGVSANREYLKSGSTYKYILIEQR